MSFKWLFDKVRRLFGGHISGTGTPTPTPTPSPTLAALSLSATTFTRGTSASGAILSSTALSTITASGLPSGFTINGAARTWAWDGTGSGSASGSLTLTETLAGATNTPRASVIGYTINAAAGAVPVPSGSARFLNFGDGTGSAVTAPIIGQPLFIDPGPFSNTPTSYNYQVYADGLAVLVDDASGAWTAGDPMPAYVPADAIVGSVLVLKCHGINASGTSVTTSDSSATSAVSDINLTSDTPANTRTSGNTVVPMTWDTVFGSNTFPDYLVRLQEGSDVGFSTIVQEVTHFLTASDLVPGATIDWASEGMAAIGVSHFIRERIEASTPSGLFRSSGWSNIIGPTNYVGDAVTDNFDDNSVNTAIWNGTGSSTPSNHPANGATVAESSGAMVITPITTGASAAGRRTLNSASLVGKFVAIRVPADFDVTQQKAYIHVGPAANQGFQALIQGNGGSSSVQLHGLDSGADTNIDGVGPVMGVYRWVVIRDDGAGHIKIDGFTSSAVPADFTTGTNLVSFTRTGWPYWNGTDACFVWIGGGSWGANASITPVAIDDFNTNMVI